MPASFVDLTTDTHKKMEVRGLKVKQEHSPHLSPRPAYRPRSAYLPTAYPTPEFEPRKSRDEDQHDRIDSVNKQQKRLFRDARSAALLKTFQTAGEVYPRTFYARLAGQGMHIMERGRPAQTSQNIDEADFLALNLIELDLWLRNGTGDKVILLRDRPWATTRPPTTASTMLQEAAFIDPDMYLDVQDLGSKYSATSPSVRSVKLQDAILQMQQRGGAPINLLNIECREEYFYLPLDR